MLEILFLRAPIDFASASDLIWPHFIIHDCKRTSKKILIEKKIYSKSQCNKFLYGNSISSTNTAFGKIKFVIFYYLIN